MCACVCVNVSDHVLDYCVTLFAKDDDARDGSTKLQSLCVPIVVSRELVQLADALTSASNSMCFAYEIRTIAYPYNRSS